MVVPVDADIDETQNITEEDRHQRAQRHPIAPVRHFQLQYHDRDDNRQHPVTKRRQPFLPHSSPLRSGLIILPRPRWAEWLKTIR